MNTRNICTNAKKRTTYGWKNVQPSVRCGMQDNFAMQNSVLCFPLGFFKIKSLVLQIERMIIDTQSTEYCQKEYSYTDS